MTRTLPFRTALLVLALPCASAFAQQLDLPRPSPSAKTTQTVGLTEIAVEYSSPAVKGRKIWGDLVPYDKVWRAGANASTKVTFSKDATVGGKPVPAGTYALFIIPAKSHFTIILNKNLQGGADEYKKETDVVRFDAKPQTIPSRERLAYVFGDFSDNSGALTLEWEKVRVALPFQVGTEQQALTNIKKMTDNAWAPYSSAASYLLTAKNYDLGIEMVDKSIAVKEVWYNVWIKASLLAGKGKYKEAYPLAEKAKSLGDKDPDNFFFADAVKKALSDWKPRL